MNTTSGYLWDNSDDLAAVHLGALTDLYDAVCREQITAVVGDLTGLHCLELAPGNGSLATWMADEVDDGGEVTAVDRDTRHVRAHPRLRVVRADLRHGIPGDGLYDVIVARLFLNHADFRDALVKDAIERLRPGGWLVTIDQSPLRPEQMVAWTADPGDPGIVSGAQSVLMRLLRDHGNDTTWARRALGVYRDAGLTDVKERVWAVDWPGGGPGCTLLRVGYRQVHHQLLRHGLSGSQLERLYTVLQDPEGIVIHGHPLVIVWARKPLGTPSPEAA
jgi:SAM-dependent methyltransferase